MEFPAEEVEALKRLILGTQRGEEGGLVYFTLPNLPLPAGVKPESCDALLCPMDRDGYPSRLFFAQKLECSKTLNWNANGFRILERNWYAFSWKLTQTGLRLVQILALHLKPLQ